MKKEILYRLAGGYGRVVRYSKLFAFRNLKVDAGMLILDPLATVGRHAHKERRHCEIYVTFSRNIVVNKLHTLISVCHEAEHEAENLSCQKHGVIVFVKLWW